MLGEGNAAPDLMNMPPGPLACWQGGKERVLTPWAPVETPAPGLAREALRALGFKGELHHGLPRPRLPVQLLLAYRGDSWALRINSVPASYSLNGKQILNE